MGLRYLNTTHEQSVADRPTGSDVGWGGQLYRDVRCLVRVVVRLKHKLAIG